MMDVQFYGQLDPGPYIDGRTWTVQQRPGEPWGLVVGPYRIEPEDGFTTDFASVPRPLWWLFPPTGSGRRAAYGPAAVIHDWLYRYGRLGASGPFISRELADEIMLAAMVALDVAPWRRRIIYRAVRMGGGGAWRGHREAERAAVAAVASSYSLPA